MTPLFPMVSAQAASQIRLAALPLAPGTWCWPHLHPGNPYPEQCSSIICHELDTWFEMYIAARRTSRRSQDGKE